METEQIIRELRRWADVRERKDKERRKQAVSMDTVEAYKPLDSTLLRVAADRLENYSLVERVADKPIK